MKREFLSIIFVIIVIALLISSCSDPVPIPASFTDAIITTSNIQFNGWRYLIPGDQYVFSAECLGIRGTGKVNIVTDRVTNVCLDPNCSHDLPFDPDLMPDYCHIPSNSDLQFIVGQELFYTYHVFRVDYDKVEKDEPNNTSVTEIFASYHITTGETRDILKIEMNEFEQMFRFIHSDGFIYYDRYIAKSQRPEKKEDYRLSLCRMKMGEYQEEVLFAFQDVCQLPDGVFPDPLAVDQRMVYFTCVENGSILRVDMANKQSSFLTGDGDGVFGVFDSPGAFYTDGHIYYTAVVPELIGTEAQRAILQLYRVNCATGENEILTKDYVSWFFVSDQQIYYQMAFAFQPTEAQLSEVGNNYSIFTLKQLNHDGSNITSIRVQLPSPYLTIVDGIGAGNSLYFRVGYNDGEVVDGYTLIVNLKSSDVLELGKSVGSGS